MLTSLATMHTYRSIFLIVIYGAAMACGGSDPEHMAGRLDAGSDAATGDASGAQPDQQATEAGGNDAPNTEAGGGQEAGTGDVDLGVEDMGEGDMSGSEGDMAGPDTGGADMADVQVDARCTSCTADQICVARYDGACEVVSVSCEDKEAGCQAPTCNESCNRRLCGNGTDASPGFSCTTTHCQGKIPVPGAFGCYGP